MNSKYAFRIGVCTVVLVAVIALSAFGVIVWPVGLFIGLCAITSIGLVSRYIVSSPESQRLQKKGSDLSNPDTALENSLPSHILAADLSPGSQCVLEELPSIVAVSRADDSQCPSEGESSSDYYQKPGGQSLLSVTSSPDLQSYQDEGASSHSVQESVQVEWRVMPEDLHKRCVPFFPHQLQAAPVSRSWRSVINDTHTKRLKAEHAKFFDDLKQASIDPSDRSLFPDPLAVWVLDMLTIGIYGKTMFVMEEEKAVEIQPFITKEIITPDVVDYLSHIRALCNGDNEKGFACIFQWLFQPETCRFLPIIAGYAKSDHARYRCLTDYIRNFSELEPTNPGLMRRADILAIHLTILNNHFDRIREVSMYASGEWTPDVYFRQEIVSQSTNAAENVALTMDLFEKKMAERNYHSVFVAYIKLGGTFHDALQEARVSGIVRGLR